MKNNNDKIGNMCYTSSRLFIPFGSKVLVFQFSDPGGNEIFKISGVRVVPLWVKICTLISLRVLKSEMTRVSTS